MEKQILNISAALDLVDGDKELLKILLDTFVTETTFDPAKLSELVASGQKEEGAKYVHAVKGAGRQLCAERLAAAGQALEDVLRGKANGDIAALTATMNSEYKIAFDAIKKATSSIE